ncbi:MAG: hypothetical protein IJ283_00600 [Oscillospiraceae bacterium]|nr:hypothetical protein [Oscillospiraceae bacterium]
MFGGDGGISAARITSAKPKIFRKAHIFGASGTHPVGSHPHHKTKKTPEGAPAIKQVPLRFVYMDVKM